VNAQARHSRRKGSFKRDTDQPHQQSAEQAVTLSPSLKAPEIPTVKEIAEQPETQATRDEPVQPVVQSVAPLTEQPAEQPDTGTREQPAVASIAEATEQVLAQSVAQPIEQSTAQPAGEIYHRLNILQPVGADIAAPGRPVEPAIQRFFGRLVRAKRPDATPSESKIDEEEFGAERIILRRGPPPE
jgi:hypothetical protein